MQYLDLVRDCIEVFGLPRLPPNDVQHAHAFDGTMGRPFKYAACDDDWNRKCRETSKPYVPGKRSDDDDTEVDEEDEGERIDGEDVGDDEDEEP